MSRLTKWRNGRGSVSSADTRALGSATFTPTVPTAVKHYIFQNVVYALGTGPYPLGNPPAGAGNVANP